MAAADAFGPTVPSSPRTKVASGSTQPPDFAARTGTVDCSSVKVIPSGFANTVE
ncbi:hypothetical protein GA0115280_1096146 [Streptomyces sp. Cmuel-A718b]|nr:hypothetical protein GA0115280_1096146 [Streptomyces sp. Cmuel-A718b]